MLNWFVNGWMVLLSYSLCAQISALMCSLLFSVLWGYTSIQFDKLYLYLKSVFPFIQKKFTRQKPRIILSMQTWRILAFWREYKVEYKQPLRYTVTLPLNLKLFSNSGTLIANHVAILLLISTGRERSVQNVHQIRVAEMRFRLQPPEVFQI